MIERFSYSSLETFKKCPAQFRIHYVDKVVKQDEGIEAFMGKRVHEALEFLYNEVKNRCLPGVDRILEKYRELWDNNFHPRLAIVRREYKPEHYFRLGEQCLAGYYRNHYPFDEPVEGNEVEFIFYLDDSDNYKMKSIIDRIDHSDDGHYIIHDYKSGKRMLTQPQADNDGQLGLYQVALAQHRDDVGSVELVWHFLQHGQEIHSRRTVGQLYNLVERTKARIDTIREKLEQGGKFYPKESILCNWCYYWEECAAKKGTNPFVVGK